MRIVLIGAGAVGSVAAARLVDVREVDELVLADVVGERSKALADRLGSRKVRAATMASGQDLGSLITGADLAVNAAHASLDLPLMEACLDVGASFMDLSSVPLQQFPYDEKFRKAGIVALLGAGEDPGLGNVLARAAADRLDKVDSIRIRDGDTITSGPTPLPVAWSPETFIVEVFADALVFQDGRIVEVPPWSGREVYPFPEPVGPQPVYLMEHEEPVTMPRFIGKGLRYVDLKLAVDDGTFETLQRLKALGLLEDTPVPVDGGSVSPRRLIVSLLPRPANLVGKVTGAAMILVEVSGTKDGEAVTHRLYVGLRHEDAARRYGATATAYLVGTGTAIFVTQFTRGQIPQRGVIAPECLDPAETLRLMSEAGLPVTHETRTTRELT